MRERRSAISTALRHAEDVRGIQAAELASTDRFIEHLRRRIRIEDDKCDQGTEEAPCFGNVFARWCRVCGFIVERCEQHGGLRSATNGIDAHRGRHAGEYARYRTANDESAVRERDPAVPLDFVQAPPLDRGDGNGHQSGNALDPERGASRDRIGRATGGSLAVRVRRRSQGVD